MVLDVRHSRAAAKTAHCSGPGPGPDTDPAMAVFSPDSPRSSFYHLLRAGWPTEQGLTGPIGEMGKPGLPMLSLCREFLEILATEEWQDTGETWVTLGRRACKGEQEPGGEMAGMAWMDSQGHRDSLAFR
ncbi:unnamed protein product [Coregonus sp. 'balchen']|nr:unnamed protein product [Coregonus sp. 'balchen']